MTRNTIALLALLAMSGLARAAESQAGAPALQTPSAEDKTHLQAIRAVLGKGPASTEDLGLLAEKLKNPSPLVRAYAARALGDSGEAARPVARELVPLAADPDPLVRREAAQALLKIRPDREVVRPLMRKMLAEADPGTRNRILNAIADLGKAAVPNLVDALKEDEAAPYAIVVLGSIGPDAADAAPALAERLKAEQRPEVRQQIVMALGAVGSAAAVPALVEELSDADEATRVAAAFGLGRIGPPAAAGSAALTKSLESPDPVLKVVSAWALAKIKPDDAAARDQAVTVLAESLTSDSPLARAAAFRGLADLRPGPAKVLPILKRQLASKDKAAVAEALHMLAEMGEPAVPALVEALKNPEGRVLAASILAYIGPPAKAAVPALIDIAKTDKNPAAKREAFMALGSIGQAEAGASVATAALGDPDEKVVIAACYALAQMGPAAREAVPALRKLAESNDDAIREEAAKALKAVAP